MQDVISLFFEENKKLQAELEALHLSTEAEKKEINILSISLKQKDAEIDRLKELTGYDSVSFFVCFVFLLIYNLNERFEKVFSTWSFIALDCTSLPQACCPVMFVY